MLWLTILYVLFIAAVCGSYMLLASTLRARIARAQMYLEGVSGIARLERRRYRHNVAMAEWAAVLRANAKIPEGWRPMTPPPARAPDLVEWGQNLFKKND